MSSPIPPHAADDFASLVDEVDAFAWRDEVHVQQIPSPQRIAPFALALTADLVVDEEDLANGRLVLLYDPAGNEAWEGAHRLVTFARAEVDSEMVSDPMLAEVGWQWLTEALAAHGASHVAPSGTVTTVSSRGFGGLQDEPDRAEVEIRASWTPVLDGGDRLALHLAAWQQLLCMVAGLPELPEGVVPLGSRMGRGR